MIHSNEKMSYPNDWILFSRDNIERKEEENITKKWIKRKK